jgi:hypothetical protein
VLGRFRGQWSDAAKRPASGRAILLLRPNAARPLVQDTASSGEVNLLHGKVVDSLFRGGGFRLNVVCQGSNGSQHAFWFETDRAYPPGQHLTLALDEQGVQFLAEEE